MIRVTSLLLALLCACASAPPAPKRVPPNPAMQRDLERYGSFRTGRFETVPQPAQRGDSTPVILRIARMWPERETEFWFYLEYAKPGQEDTPYWQRITRADAGDVVDRLKEYEYEVPDPKALVGAWRDPKRFAALDRDRLVEIPACRQDLSTMQLTMYASGVLGKACTSGTPAGAAYRASEAFITSSGLRAWDRAYDAAGKIVWGTPGPLEMNRVSQQPR